MSRLFKVIFVSAISFIVMIGAQGCTKKPNQQEVSKLEEARSAAENSEKKLSELRQERMQLEQDLQGKKDELSNQQRTRDSLKDKDK